MIRGRKRVEIHFASVRLRDLCNDQRALVRLYGKRGAQKVRQRLDDLDGAPTLETMRSLPGRCHELSGDRSWQLALTIDGNKRLIFEPLHPTAVQKSDGGLDWKLVTAVHILGVEDYH